MSSNRTTSVVLVAIALAATALWWATRRPTSPPSAGPAPSMERGPDPRRPAVLESRPRSTPAEAPPAPSAMAEPDATAPAADSTSISLDVVAEDGARLREGVVVFKAPDLELMKRG